MRGANGLMQSQEASLLGLKDYLLAHTSLPKMVLLSIIVWHVSDNCHARTFTMDCSTQYASYV